MGARTQDLSSVCRRASVLRLCTCTYVCVRRLLLDVPSSAGQLLTRGTDCPPLSQAVPQLVLTIRDNRLQRNLLINSASLSLLSASSELQRVGSGGKLSSFGTHPL